MGLLGPGVLFMGLLGPGVFASILSSIRLSSAADLNETPLRFSNDPFPFVPCVSLIFQFLMVNVYTFLGPLGPFSRSSGIPSWYWFCVFLAILVP